MRKDDSYKRVAAERLFEAFGEIDDTIIKEAEARYQKRSSGIRLTRFISVAATAVVLLVCMSSVLVIGNLSKSDSDMSKVPDKIEDAGISNSQSLENILHEVSETEAVRFSSVDDIDYFDGEVSLIWNFVGQDVYYSLKFSQNVSAATVKNNLSGTTKQLDANSLSVVVCNVWVSYGDGTVVSPYLKESCGNVGYAELFEYSPEIEPSEKFTRFVEREFLN